MRMGWRGRSDRGVRKSLAVTSFHSKHSRDGAGEAASHYRAEAENASLPPRCLLVASSLLPRCFQDQPSKLEFRTRWLRPAAAPCGQETQLGKGSAGTSPFARKSFASLASAQVESDPPRELTRPADVRARKNTQVVEQV